MAAHYINEILATVLVNMLPKVLTHLMSDLEGRSGIFNTRLIQDMIDYSAFNNNDSVIIFADLKKAFDTLEWTFVDTCLKSYGVKDNFRKWVSVMYYDPHLSERLVIKIWNRGVPYLHDYLSLALKLLQMRIGKITISYA